MLKHNYARESLSILCPQFNIFPFPLHKQNELIQHTANAATSFAKDPFLYQNTN